jgi:glycosyltransferase involved in cell wall biosynthesis
MDRTRVQFDFVYFSTPPKENHIEEISALGGRTYKIDRPSLKNAAFYKKKVAEKFLSGLDYDYKIAHFHTFILVNLFYKALRKNNIKVITHSHNTKLSSNFFKSIRNRLICTGLNRHTDYKVACSRLAGEKLFGKKSFNKDGKIIFNAIDLDRFIFSDVGREKIRQEFNLTDKIVLIHVGRLEKQKNHPFLLKIMTALVKESPKYHLLLVGRGPDGDKLKEIVKRKGLKDHVTFAGIRNDIPDILSAGDVFVFPSLFEGLGIAVVEAQANGLNCVVSNNVPKEASASDSVRFRQLNNLGAWLSDIKESVQPERENLNENLVKAGYDIKTEAVKLQEFYIREVLSGSLKE